MCYDYTVCEKCSRREENKPKCPYRNMSLIRALIIEGYTNHIDEWVNEKLYFTWYDGYPEHILPLLQAENYGEFEEISEFPFPQSIYDFVYYIDGSNRAKRLYTVLGYDWEFHRKYNVTSFKIIKEGVL